MNQSNIKLITDWYINLYGQTTCKGTVVDQDDLDQDHDQDLLHKGSRSDLDQDHDHDPLNWFRKYAKSHGVDTEGLDLTNIKRNATWLKEHYEDIKYPKAYILKMISGCGPEKPQPKPPVGFQPPKKEDDKPITEIYGFQISEIDQLRPYLDKPTWQRVFSQLPEATRFLFRPYEAVIESEHKSRILIAEGLKRGLL